AVALNADGRESAPSPVATADVGNVGMSLQLASVREGREALLLVNIENAGALQASGSELRFSYPPHLVEPVRIEGGLDEAAQWTFEVAAPGEVVVRGVAGGSFSPLREKLIGVVFSARTGVRNEAGT